MLIDTEPKRNRILAETVKLREDENKLTPRLKEVKSVGLMLPLQESC